jgi:hypothetical protein
MTTAEMVAYINDRTENPAPAEPITDVKALLISNTLTAINNAQADLPQYHTEIERMKMDMYAVASPHPKLCLYLLQALQEMYDGTYEA